jgi:two-component system CheB/CheR fusion protein
MAEGSDSSGYRGRASRSPAASRALRRALLDWNRLLETLPVGVYICDADGYLVQYNRRAAELWGLSPDIDKREARYCGAHRAFTPTGELISGANAPMTELLAGGRPIRDREVIVERPDGSRIAVLANLDPLFEQDGRLVGGVSCFQDISERKGAEEQKTMLVRELAHRVNNIFAVVLAITQQSLRTASSAQAFAETFTARLQSLARAHSLLLARDWTGADLEELAREQIAPFKPRAEELLRIEGPKVMLQPGQVIALGAVLHELATNAYKYGALSAPNGCVALGWVLTRKDGVDHVELTWRERGGPRVKRPSKQGLGSRIIQRGLPNATIAWRFAPEGVSCEIVLALEAPRPASATPRALKISVSPTRNSNSSVQLAQSSPAPEVLPKR